MISVRVRAGVCVRRKMRGAERRCLRGEEIDQSILICGVSRDAEIDPCSSPSHSLE